MANSSEVTPEERRHAQRALSMMMNIQWKADYFPSIDMAEAKRILDSQLFGLERVKQRIMETIVQINRTHTLPAYGLLLVGPAGVGKSQIIRQIGRKFGYKVIDIRLAQMSEVEIGGLIYPNESRTKTVWLAPDVLPNEERDGKTPFCCWMRSPPARNGCRWRPIS